MIPQATSPSRTLWLIVALQFLSDQPTFVASMKRA
jgi:hypothetical protein